MRGRKEEEPLPAPPLYAAAEGANAPQRETTATMANDVAPQPAVAAPPLAPAPKAASAGFWLQFGAYAKLDGAEQERNRLADGADWLAPLLAIFKDRNLNRLQAGPYATQADARAAAARLREAMGLNVLIVERK
jgi:rare lipoprotein A